MKVEPTKTPFSPEELVATAERLLSESQKVDTQLCDLPINEDERALVGRHLVGANERQAANNRVLRILRVIAGDIENALAKDTTQVKNPELLSEANTVLNAAVPDSTKEIILDTETGEKREVIIDGINAGQLDAITFAFEDIRTETKLLLERIQASAPTYEYFFDLRFTGDVPEHTWLKDFERLTSSMEKLSEKLKVFLQKGITAYGATEIANTMDGTVAGSMNETEDGKKIPEFIARARLLKNHFDQLTQQNPPSKLSENLAFHYREVTVLLCKMMSQFKFHFTAEHEDPGMLIENSQIIARSYPERLEIFLDIFKYCIIATNTAKRALLLLEC